MKILSLKDFSRLAITEKVNPIKTYGDDVKNAVYNYVAGYTTSVNNELRSGRVSKGAKVEIELLEKAFDKKTMVDVYRTVDWGYMENIYNIRMENIKGIVGSVLHCKAFLSTTKRFASPWASDWSSNELVVHTKSKKPIPCVVINDMFAKNEIDCSEQDEVLLPRDLKLKVEGAKTFTNKEGEDIWMLDVTVA